MIPGLGTLVRLVEKVSGNVIPERDLERFSSLVEIRISETKLPDLDAYIGLLNRDKEGEEWRRLLSLITVNESYFFRSIQQFDALRDVVIPEIVMRRMPPRFSVWSAGGARGEEACTLAMVLAESPMLVGWNWQILATDVDEVALADARRGLYGERAVAKVPAEQLEKFFKKRGEFYEFSPVLRERIEYVNLNLVKEPLAVPRQDFDIVFFRNVLIYFRPESQKRVARAVASLMADDGYLFLGASESLWQLYPDLEPVDLGNCFSYRWARRAPPAPESEDVWKKLEESTGKNTVVPRRKDSQESEIVPEKNGAEISRRAGRAAIVEAIKDGLFVEARDMVVDATHRYPDDPVVRALEGLISDLLDEALNAIRSYRAALYLDGNLYQVRFLLARCLDRLGRRERARREYQAVLAMIDRADSKELPLALDLGLPHRQQIKIQSLAKTR